MDGIDISDWNKLGAVIRAARLQAGLTQQELAERSGTARSWIARMEAGHRKAELEQLLRLLDALDLRITLHPTAQDERSPRGDATRRAMAAAADLAAVTSASGSATAKLIEHARAALQTRQDELRQSWETSAGAHGRLDASESAPSTDDRGTSS